MCWLLWIAGLIILYKIIDWLIRLPTISDYNNHYVMITGCDSGFGFQLARRLDSKGAHVFAGCLTEAGEKELKEGSTSGKLVTVPLDVTSTESIEKAYALVKMSLPAGEGLLGMVNNAGVLGSIGPSEWMLRGDFNKVFAVNIIGLAEVTRIFLPLVKLTRGRIVNTGSSSARYAQPFNSPYVCSKYAVAGYSDSLRRELYPYKIKVSIVEPGVHRTTLFKEAQELTKTAFKRPWEQISPELREEYGERYKDEIADMMEDSFEYFMTTTMNDVVDAYEHALFALYPCTRYAPGFDCKFVFIPLSYMPTFVQDMLPRLVAKVLPTPASCK